MSDLRDLYQEIILEHGKNPRNCHKLNDANHQAEGFNPLCGDKITVYLKTEADKIVDAGFKGSGCAISMASASLLTEALKGKSLVEAEKLFKQFQSAMTANLEDEVDLKPLGKLSVLAGVREFPMRVKCATLACHTLRNALEDSTDVANTDQGEDA